MKKELFYATNNPGKRFEAVKHLGHHGIKVTTPADYEINIDVDESGNSLEENAILKAKAYADLLSDTLIMSDDTGLEIDALNGEPGIHVRRWKDGKNAMSDEELIDYCLEKMKGIPKEKRGAQFKTVLALNIPGKGIEIFTGILRGYILEEASPIRVEGFPFKSLFFVEEWNMLLGDAMELPVEDKQHLLNHREKAMNKAVPRIRELLQN